MDNKVIKSQEGIAIDKTIRNFKNRGSEGKIRAYQIIPETCHKKVSKLIIK